MVTMRARMFEVQWLVVSEVRIGADFKMSFRWK